MDSDRPTLTETARASTVDGHESSDDQDEDEDFQSDSEASDPDGDDDHVKARFDQITDAARSFTITLRDSTKNRGERSKMHMNFVDNHREAMTGKTREGQNFLHHLAYYNYRQDGAGEPRSSLQWLMARAVLRLSPELMGDMDNMERTPLTAALMCGNGMFAYAVCRNLTLTTRQRFKVPLLSECEYAGNNQRITCLHAVFTCPFDHEDLRPSIVKDLCSFVPKQMFSTTVHRGRTPLHLAVEFERCCTRQVSVVEELLRWGPAALEILIPLEIYSNRSVSVYQYHQHTREMGEQRIRAQARTGEENPEDADNSLRLQEETDKELWYDFGAPKKTSRAAFLKHFDYLQFERILKHAAFPQIELENNRETSNAKAQSKEDITFFFEWLGGKGVARIINVVVDDLKTPSHSDQAIEKALLPFDVEILDWRRLDLDPVSLCRIGNQLREIYLYWGGRNAVLRAWSEKEGLARIPTLEVIHLCQQEAFESSERTEQNLDAFESRLQDSWPSDVSSPKVIRSRSNSGK
ncbi:hypothetical protein FSARC_4140 [Fusarium sarcochroum]|uniref:Ankyrin n=1 Tax=Fusarium sarcochroum TaxID=1208366 RepID=A0A8H4XBS9_9HYPO|nr:hypothetical protein FSARC_4140 [Fusarium sarcochroum]